MLNNRLLHTLLFSGFLFASQPLQAAMQVFSLEHRMASELVPLLQPFLNDDEGLAANGQQLIVQASAERLQELTELLQQLDVPLRRLLITLDDSGSRHVQGSDQSISGRISTRHGDVTLGEPNTGANNQLSIRRYSSGSSDQGMRSVQTLEGQAARISTGQQIIRRHVEQQHHGRPRLQTVEQNLQQGFTVVARVQGNQVVLQLDFSNDQLLPQDPRIVQKAALSTQVSGPLGSWIELGDLQHKQLQAESELLEKRRLYSSEYNNLRIKVDLLN